MPLVYIALGSNLGDRMSNLRGALARLSTQFPIKILRASPVYENRAVGMGEADDFLNAIVEVQTDLDSESVLNACLDVEQQLGRTRSNEGWAPRTIDLDLIYFEGVEMDSQRLTLPHPRIAERDFVAVPLLDLAPDLSINGKQVKELIEALERIDLVKTDHTLID